jgi:hypothetical protein
MIKWLVWKTPENADGYLRRTADDIFPDLHTAKLYSGPVEFYDNGHLRK